MGSSSIELVDLENKLLKSPQWWKSELKLQQPQLQPQMKS